MPLYRERVYGVLVKIETTSGTDAVPDPAVNAVAPSGVPTITVDYLEQGLRDDMQNGTLITPDRAEAAGRFGTLELKVEIRGGGTAGSTPEADALLRMSGLSVTTSAGVSKTYTTLDTGTETATVYCYGGGKLFKLVGASASLKVDAEAAKRGFMTFSIKGKLGADPTETALPALTFSTVSPPLFHSAATSIGAWTSASAEAMQLLTVAIDTGTVVTELPSAGAADGLVGFVVSDRKSTQTMTVRTPAIATFDPYTLSKTAGSATPVTAWQLGTVAGNRCKVATGKWAIKAPKLGAANSVNTYALDGTLGTGAAGATTRELVFLYD